jgi:hypothetical protein
MSKKNIWQDLSEMRNTLSNLPMSQVKKYISENMEDEVEILVNQFKTDFKDIPTTDPLRIEILQTLAEIGIIIYDDTC